MKVSRNNVSDPGTSPKASVVSTRCRRHLVLFLVVALVAWIGAASAVWGLCAWELLYTFEGQATEDCLGQSVSGAGDVNNDGYADVIVGAPNNNTGGSDAGEAYVYSGQTGGLLWTFTGEAAGDLLGYTVSGAGDVNNDGYDDLIVGAWQNDGGGEGAGRAYVYSGQTGGLLWTFDGEAGGDWLGISVSGAGDVNNDGHDDLIVGASGNDAGGSDAGRAYVYSGQTGALLWTFTGQAGGDEFGTSVSGAGDVNSDGHADLFVGAYLNDAGGMWAGRAYVYSGQTGGLIWTFTGEAVLDIFGTSVSGAGDVDDDGYDDLIVGAPGNDTGASNAGRAYVYSGQTGGLLWTFDGEAESDQLGWSVSGAGDVNDDGYADLIVGAWQNDVGGEGAGRAYVYSGQSGVQLCTFTGEATGDYLGNSVSGAGDVNEDGYADLIVGAYRNDAGGTDAGRAYVYSGHTGILCFTGEAAGDLFGWSVSGAGDVNDDGYDDLIVGALYNDWGGTDAGRAYVYSGQTGGVLWTFTGESAYDRFGYSLSGAGDVNNDGYDDLIVAAPWNDAESDSAGRAYVYSGQTGGLLWTFTGEAAGDLFGWSVSGAGDVNNDGFADLIVGAPENDGGASNAGRAYVYSGQTGGLIWTFTREAEFDHFGWSVSGAGDVDNDGYEDLIVGIPYSALAKQPQACVYSGQTGEKLWLFTADSPGDQFGHSVSGAGDVNNDGTPDVIVGALQLLPDPDSGQAYVYSGQTGDLLWTFTGEGVHEYFGVSVSGAGDVNKDGFDDVIVGAPCNSAGGWDAGRAYCYSGLRGGLLCTFTGDAADNHFGHSVSGAGDVNNDGFDEVIVGAPYNNAGGAGAGRAYVYACQVQEPYICGDVNGDEVINSADVVYLINYLFKGGPPPAPECVGDVNCDDVINSADVVYLIDYLFKGGPEPGPDCCP